MLGFRVWDVQLEKFNNSDCFLMHREGYIGELLDDTYLEYSRFENIATNERYIPMQSTGLKDMNGKEIFEGDMIFIYTKTQNNGYYLVKTAKDFSFYLGTIVLDLIKISNDGNVYEHPELLERLKC